MKTLFRRFVSIAALLAFSAPAFGAVQITDGTDTLLIGGTNKAAAVQQFDARGNDMNQKVTYSAGTTALTATAAGTAPFFAICGSGTKTVRVQRFNINGTVATAAVRQAVVLTKTSTATSAGTPVTLTTTPHDSASGAATATATYYSALATAGSRAGTVGVKMKNWPITATMASTDYTPELEWVFAGGYGEAEAIVLRGTAQCVEASFGATTTNAPTLSLEVTWTEE